MFVKFSELNSADFKRDPYELLKTLRQQGPLVDTRIWLLGKIRLATTYQATCEMLQDRKRFVIEAQNAGVGKLGDFRSYLPGNLRVLMSNMLQKDEPDHRRLRSFAEQAFLARNVAGMKDGIIAQTDRLLGDFASESVVDLVSQFARRLPLMVICQLLGLPAKDEERFVAWSSAITNATSRWGLLRMLPSIRRMQVYLRSRFREERAVLAVLAVLAVRSGQLGEGLISQLVAAEQASDRLSDDELLAMTFLLLMAGHETTTHAISLSLMTLMQRPDLRQQWMGQSEVRPLAVKELMRFLSPVQMTKVRYVTQDTVVDGVPVAKGDRMMALLAAANHDPAQFKDADVIDFSREPNSHVEFGSGIHHCLGARLASLEIETAITSFFDRFPDATLEPITQKDWSCRVGIRGLRRLSVKIR